MSVKVPEFQTRFVRCPYCKADILNIDIGPTTSTLVYSDWMAFFNPNLVSTQYDCRKCHKRFWIDRIVQTVKLKEEYVIKENGRIERREKEGYSYSRT